MSEEEGGGYGINAIEKLFGLILLMMGIIAMYYTLTSADVLGSFTGFFGFMSLVLLMIGVFLLLVKVE